MTSVDELASVIGVPSRTIRAVASRAGRFYSTRPNQGPRGCRTLRKPRPVLRRIQAKLYKEWLRSIPQPPTMFGGVPGRSHLDHVRLHAGRSHVLTVDLKACFDRISNGHVHRAIIALGVSPDVARLITQLTTVDGRLPQGAPTSNALANLCLRPLHGQLTRVCGAAGLLISFYVDDIAVSGELAPLRKSVAAIISCIEDAGHAVSCRKIRLVGGSSKRIAGVVAARPLRVPREYRKRVRREILALRGADPCDAGWKRVEGMVSYVRDVSCRQARPLVRLLADARR